MKQTLTKDEEEAKESKSGWRGVERLARRQLREQLYALQNLRTKGIDARRASALRNVATAAAIAKDKAYPEDLVSGLTVFLPARLLQSVQGAMLKVKAVKVINGPENGSNQDDTPTGS